MCISNEDKISAFLETIPEDCKNSELVLAKGIIEDDRSQFFSIGWHCHPPPFLSIKTNEHGVPTANHIIINTSQLNTRFQ